MRLLKELLDHRWWAQQASISAMRLSSVIDLYMRAKKLLRTTNTLLARLMDYRKYCLSNTNQRPTPHATGEVRSFGDKLKLTLKEPEFEGSDGIQVFDFLRSLARECELADMREGKNLSSTPKDVEEIGI